VRALVVAMVSGIRLPISPAGVIRKNRFVSPSRGSQCCSLSWMTSRCGDSILAHGTLPEMAGAISVIESAKLAKRMLPIAILLEQRSSKTRLADGTVETRKYVVPAIEVAPSRLTLGAADDVPPELEDGAPRLVEDTGTGRTVDLETGEIIEDPEPVTHVEDDLEVKRAEKLRELSERSQEELPKPWAGRMHIMAQEVGAQLYLDGEKLLDAAIARVTHRRTTSANGVHSQAEANLVAKTLNDVRLGRINAWPDIHGEIELSSVEEVDA
jgi:hypothetical protein